MVRKKKPRTRKRFVGIPHEVVKSASYAKINGSAAKLLTLIAMQYNGKNNGDFTCTWDQMKPYFGGQDTMRKALKALRHHRLIEVTGTGTTQRKGRMPPTLYAITWEAIDDYSKKGHMTATPTITPIRNDWAPHN
ncbi:hypothetical protein [Agarivorans sp. Z349TD_8]|uniref:hypothetical protein n=1 Tax=Agarivorans sp. Z349TD_8 TaxID=3421434 RepID=UPI003D7D65C1